MKKNPNQIFSVFKKLKNHHLRDIEMFQAARTLYLHYGKLHEQAIKNRKQEESKAKNKALKSKEYKKMTDEYHQEMKSLFLLSIIFFLCFICWPDQIWYPISGIIALGCFFGNVFPFYYKERKKLVKTFLLKSEYGSVYEYLDSPFYEQNHKKILDYIGIITKARQSFEDFLTSKKLEKPKKTILTAKRLQREERKIESQLLREYSPWEKKRSTKILRSAAHQQLVQKYQQEEHEAREWYQLVYPKLKTLSRRYNVPINSIYSLYE